MKNLNKNTIIGSRTTLQIKKETLKKMMDLKKANFHPRATYDEIFNKLIEKELRKTDINKLNKNGNGM